MDQNQNNKSVRQTRTIALDTARLYKQGKISDEVLKKMDKEFLSEIQSLASTLPEIETNLSIPKNTIPNNNNNTVKETVVTSGVTRIEPKKEPEPQKPKADPTDEEKLQLELSEIEAKKIDLKNQITELEIERKQVIVQLSEIKSQELGIEKVESSKKLKKLS